MAVFFILSPSKRYCAATIDNIGQIGPYRFPHIGIRRLTDVAHDPGGVIRIGGIHFPEYFGHHVIDDLLHATRVYLHSLGQIVHILNAAPPVFQAQAGILSKRRAHE